MNISLSQERILSNSDRLEFVDIAKGLGIILVVCSHTVYPQLMYFANLFFIPLFFVLSGYTLHTLSLKKKAIRLLKPYFLFNIAIALMMYVSRLKDVSLNHLVGIIYSRFALYPLETGGENHIFMNIGNSPTWFLTCMFIAFVLLYFILQAKKYRYWVLASYVGLTVAFNELPILLPWSIDVAFLMAVFMYGGMLLREKGWMNLSVVYVIVFCLAYIALSYLTGYCNLSVRNYGNSILLFLIGGIIGSYLIIRLAQLLEKTFLKKVLVAIGQHSLVIFCIQIPILFVIQKLCSRFMLYLPEDVQLLGLSFMQIIFTLSIGYAISRFINRFMPVVVK